MSSNEVGSVLLTICILLISAHIFGYIFVRLHQPRLIGEIIAGILLGPFIFGRLEPLIFTDVFGSLAEDSQIKAVIGFIYWFGLLLLMFISGSQVRRIFAEENRKETTWIVGIGTALPIFVVCTLGLVSIIPINPLVGVAEQKTSALLILSISVAVTSIPVISRIFYDLKIIHTRFASLILGIALLEDIILWVVLAIATAIASTATLAHQQVVSKIASHVGATIVFITIALFLMPNLLKKLNVSRWNILYKSSPLGYVILILLLYAVAATLFEVNLVFAAFLAGFGVVGGMSGSERARFSNILEAIEHFSTSTFIPIYFALVGYRLVFGTEFSPLMLVSFLVGSSLLALVSVGLAAKMAGFRGLDIINIAITKNARGGPGIVLASVAFDAGIINGAFYTTLVLAAVLTSQAAGVWLRFILDKGLPLLSSNPNETWKVLPKLNKQRSHVPQEVALLDSFSKNIDLQNQGDNPIL